MCDDEEPGEVDLADDDLRDSRGRTKEDYEADRADDLIKEMKIEGTYEAWKRSRLSLGEFNRDQAEREFEAARAAHARRLAEARRLDGPDGL